MPPLQNLVGLRSGLLIVKKWSHCVKTKTLTRHFWKCQCQCGNWPTVEGYRLRKRLTKSCGCLRLANPSVTTHGRSKTPEHRIWKGMWGRCTNSRNPSFKYYGARGITVCERWRRFENFYTDVGPRPSQKHSLDRFPNVNGNYEPGNVRWATASEQARNTRRNHMISYQGQLVCLSDAAALAKLSASRVSNRIAAGWTEEEALSIPAKDGTNYITHQGLTLPASHWAKKAGVNPKTFLHRLERGMSIEQALSTPALHAYALEYHGEIHSITEWAKRYGMSDVVLGQRLRRFDGDLARALNTPLRQLKRT